HERESRIRWAVVPDIAARQGARDSPDDRRAEARYRPRDRRRDCTRYCEARRRGRRARARRRKRSLSGEELRGGDRGASWRSSVIMRRAVRSLFLAATLPLVACFGSKQEPPKEPSPAIGTSTVPPHPVAGPDPRDPP